jgi:putative ABC transport system permease protein
VNALAWRLARRELRGGIRSRFRGFRIFLACLALGTAAIAAVGSLSSAIETGLGTEARALLGGDVELRIHHRPATDEQRQWLAERGQLSEVIEVRAMARDSDGGKQRLVELKAVDDLYPLVARLEIRGGRTLAEALAPVAGTDGAVVAESLLEKLGLSVGDRLAMGEAEFHIVGVIAREPDRVTRGVQLGPRVIINRAGLDRTALLQPGSLSRYLYRIVLPAGVETAPFIEALGEAFPDAAWRVRDPGRAAPGLKRFVDRLTLFLTLVGLSALLIGGVGVGNAVHAFLTQRRPTIATLKCLGAPAGLVLRVYLMQVMGLAAIGVAGGLVVGAASPLIAAPLLSDLLPVSLAVGVYPGPLLLAVAFGVVTTLVFSLGPLMLARDVPAAALFRQTVAGARRKVRWPDVGGLTALTLLLMLLTILSARDKPLAIWFVAGASVAFVAFRLAAAAVIWLARAAPRSKWPRLRLAVANLHRPGTPTPSVVLSLGLGITVLVAIMMIERNLSNRIEEAVTEEAPSFFFIDIQPDQVGPFEALAAGFPEAGPVHRVPMLRARITAIAGVSTAEITPPPHFAWVTRGDRGITWSATPPRRGSEVVEGEWWSADYGGPPLISFDKAAAEAFGIGIGDNMTFNILGREITAEIGNLREIDWATLGMNFMVIFSPGALDGAPQVNIATLRIPQDRELALETAVTKAFPNVSAIRVREILADVNRIMVSIDTAMKAIAAIAITAGILVLSGAIAAGRRQRIYDAVILKTLGATRADVLGAYLIEFALLGLATAGIAAAAGSLAAWAVTTHLMHLDWSFTPAAMVWTTAICVLATMGFGVMGAWRALGQKAAPLLRND